LWIARRRGMKTATLFRSGGTDFFPGDRLFTPAVDVWISASQYNARQVEERYGRSVRVIYNGVDTNLFRPRDRDPQIRNSWGVPAGAPLIMSCGRLVGWKGLHIVIEAIGPLLDVHFVIVGEGPERARLERMVMALQLQERVHFRGIIAHDQLPEALSQSDIFVQPSLGEEAFGISVVEAMAVGIPVLASCNGGLKEIVVPERTGLLLPPGEVKAWREAIDEMIRRPDVRHSMGREARGRVESEFTWSNNARILETLLQRKRCAES
jgi:glycosyltransferase involved in cell wall biosynthesis